jgi:diguanylate cyclase
VQRQPTDFKTVCAEFAALIVATTLLSGAAAFYMFRPYGEYIMMDALRFAVAAPLLAAGPYLGYLALRLSDLHVRNDGLERAVKTDRLTGLLNRHGFDLAVRSHMRALASNAGPSGLMIIIVDADHFKRINDRLGHPVGDRALQVIAAALRQSVRSSDAVGRLGGEEFALSLPCGSLEEGRAIAERLRLAINRLSVGERGRQARLSVSVGGAFINAPQKFDTVYAIADANLYRSKEGGRNRSTITGMAREARRRLRFGGDQPAMAAARG